jgi:hypothetical protein
MTGRDRDGRDMTGRDRKAGGVVALLVGISAVVGVAFAGVPAAHAAPPEPTVFTLVFDLLEPGVPQSRTAEFTLSRDAELVSFSWLERSGVMADVDLAVIVCSAGGTCVDPTTLTGSVAFPAGATSVTVTATLNAATVVNPVGSIVGRLTFGAEEALGPTGTDVLALAAWAGAVVLTGALLVQLVRNRRRGVTAHGDAHLQ